MSEEPVGQVEWFESNGRFTGVLMLVMWAALAVLGVLGHADPAFLGALLLVAALTHAVMLRPRVGTTARHLVYRRMFTDLAVPLARIDTVRVTRYFQVTVDTRRYVSPVIARRRRRTARPAFGRAEAFAAAHAGDDRIDPRSVYADLVEDTVRARIADARAREARPGEVPDEIRRTWSRAELGAVAVAGVVLLVLLGI